jgi:hypothetical protein
LDDPATSLTSDQTLQKMEPNAKINNDIGDGVNFRTFKVGE